MQEEVYKVQLENIFEGPMDLLVHLIKKNELDIYDIPIALVTEQYLQYMEWMKAMNIDLAGDFIVLASTLTQIKSRMLLPASSDEEEDDPRQEIVRPLVEYLQMKSAAE
ncbi:MAG: segregation/condensation protein A, partial [Desulfobacterales bacterium]